MIYETSAVRPGRARMTRFRPVTWLWTRHARTTRRSRPRASPAAAVLAQGDPIRHARRRRISRRRGGNGCSRSATACCWDPASADRWTASPGPPAWRPTPPSQSSSSCGSSHPVGGGARGSRGSLTSLSAGDREVYATAHRQRRAGCGGLCEHDPGWPRANAGDTSERAVCDVELRSGGVEAHPDHVGDHALGGRRWWRWWWRRRWARSHGVDERRLVSSSEDGGAEVSGAAVGRKARLCVQDLVATVLVG